MTQKKPDWLRMQFKNNKVWVAVGKDGRPAIENGKALIKYRLDQDYQYRVNPANLRPLDAVRVSGESSAKPSSPTDRTCPNGSDAQELDSGRMVRIFTDGASSGNPGPSGIGVVLRYGENKKEISEFIGNATNNIAELRAIEAGLSALKSRDIPVRLFTDSSYAFGLLTQNWKPRKNRQLIESIKQKMRSFRDLKFIKVKGHSGHPENERADYLATAAIKKAGQ